MRQSLTQKLYDVGVSHFNFSILQFSNPSVSSPRDISPHDARIYSAYCPIVSSAGFKTPGHPIFIVTVELISRSGYDFIIINLR